MSRKRAIDDHCKSCCYDPKSGLGTWRKQVEDCPCTSCCLYYYRPRTTTKQVNPELVSDVLEQPRV